MQDPKTGQTRPASFVDVVNFHVKNFEKDYEELIKNLRSVITYEMDYESSVSASRSYFDEFERKYGIGLDDMAPTLILLLKMRSYLEKGAKGEITDRPLMEYVSDLQDIDLLLYGDIKKSFLAKVLDKLEMAMNENLARLKVAEEMRKSTGSGNLPGAVQDDCPTST